MVWCSNFVVFPSISVVNTKIQYGYNFVAPLKLMIYNWKLYLWFIERKGFLSWKKKKYYSMICYNPNYSYPFLVTIITAPLFGHVAPSFDELKPLPPMIWAFQSLSPLHLLSWEHTMKGRLVYNVYINFWLFFYIGMTLLFWGLNEIG